MSEMHTHIYAVINCNITQKYISSESTCYGLIFKVLNDYRTIGIIDA